MKKVVEVLQQLVRAGTLQAYAVGGGVAATFYVEPVLTYDLDVFVVLAPAEGLLVSLAPLYEKLRELDFQAEAEHVVVDGMPVQFIPAYNALVEEAVAEARDLSYSGIVVKVVRPEHLLAIMVQTGRPKDHARIALFEDEAAVDALVLEDILQRHALEGHWQKLRSGVK